MKSNLISFFISLIAGAVYSLAYPSFLGAGWLPLTFISLPVFLWFLEESTFKRSLLMILAFNLGLDLCGYYWIPHTLREFGQLPFAVSILLGTLFCLILQPHWWAYAIWRKYRPHLNWTSEKGVILTALVMTLLERYIPQQFPSFVGSPWLHLAPFLGLAPYFGIAIFSFMTYWICLEAVVQLKSKKLRPQSWIAISIFIAINAMIPLKNPDTKRGLSVRVVQANIGNFLKVSSEKGDSNSYETVEQTYLKLSKNGDFKPELIIWPETAYPETFFGEASQVQQVFHEIMEETNAEILIGGYDQDTTKSLSDFVESVYNSSILLSDGKVKSTYHKNILIPFGETLPFGPLNRTIVSIVPTISLFARGDGTPLMETRDGYRFITPICYEILETDYMRSLLNQYDGNHFIVNHTNDSWYGDTAEPEQHLFLSKWRALEFQLPIIRSTNTGITSVIFPDGSESKRLDINQVAALDMYVPMADSFATVYQKYGIFPVLLLIGLILGVTWWREKTQHR